jgi:hypothetical protein
MASQPPTEETLPLRGAKSARLVFTNGCAPRVRVAAGAPEGAVVVTRFEHPRPQVRGATGLVKIEFPGLFQSLVRGMPKPGEVLLAAGIPWDIEIRGGSARATMDLSGLDVRSVRVRGGASDLQITLGAPRGIVPIVVDGGASGVRVLRPPGTPVRLDVRGGASHLQLDASSFGAVGGPLHLGSAGADAALDRYDIEVRGGASSLRVEEGSA